MWPNTDKAVYNAMDRLARQLQNECFDPGVYAGNISIGPWKDVTPIDYETANNILVAVSEGGTLRAVARAFNVTVTRIQRFRFASKEFGDAMNEALEMRKTLLEDKAFELAYHGSETRVTKGKGDNASTEVRTDYPAGALLQFLLKAEVPDKYGIDRQEIKAGPLDEPPTVIRSNAQREKLLAKLQSRAREREEIPGAADVPIDPSLFT